MVFEFRRGCKPTAHHDIFVDTIKLSKKKIYRMHFLNFLENYRYSDTQKKSSILLCKYTVNQYIDVKKKTQ